MTATDLDQQLAELRSAADAYAARHQFIPDLTWPETVRIAVNFTCDFDAMLLRRLLNEPPMQLAKGEFGGRVGIWRLIELFDAHGVKATIFTPGRICELYPQALRAVVKSGHEIADHMWEHRVPKEPALEEDHLAKTVAALERVAGRRPTGTRSSHSAALLRQYGYIYRSEGSADQRHPRGSVVHRVLAILPVTRTTGPIIVALIAAPFRAPPRPCSHKRGPKAPTSGRITSSTSRDRPRPGGSDRCGPCPRTAPRLAALERVAGRRPTGTRSSHSAALLRQYGYIYRSEGSADQRPHYEFDESGGNGLVNLPMHYVIDDAMYFNFNWLGSDPSAQRITDPERVCDIWWAAFRQQYNVGGYVNVCMHPFQSGRALRIAMLDRLIARMKTLPGVWFPTCEQVARYCIDRYPPRVGAL